MITIIPVDKKYRSCNVCMGKAALEVFFRSDFNNHGNVVTLCNRCARDLISRVKEVVSDDCHRHGDA